MLHEFQGYGGAAARSARPSARYQAPPTFAGHSPSPPRTGFEGRSRPGRRPSRASSTGRSSSPRSSRSDYGGSDYGGRSSPRSASSSPRSWRPTSRGSSFPPPPPSASPPPPPPPPPLYSASASSSLGRKVAGRYGDGPPSSPRTMSSSRSSSMPRAGSMPRASTSGFERESPDSVAAFGDSAYHHYGLTAASKPPSPPVPRGRPRSRAGSMPRASTTNYFDHSPPPSSPRSSSSSPVCTRTCGGWSDAQST